MLWIVVFIDVGLKWLVNGKDTGLYGLTLNTYENFGPESRLAQ